MPDISDVEAALADLVTAALYPQGTAAPSVVGPVCRVYRGFPTQAALDTDLATGRLNVTVFPVPDSTRNTTRFLPDTQVRYITPTLLAGAAGNTAAFTGLAGAGQVAGLLVDNKSYAYRCADGDTAPLVAAILAQAVRADRPAQLDGATITIPGAARVVARTGADCPATREVRRQLTRFRITVWSPTAPLRDRAAAAIDAALADTPWLQAAGQPCRLTTRGGRVTDNEQTASLYRRDLVYAVDYATTLTQPLPVMLFGDLTENGGSFLT